MIVEKLTQFFAPWQTLYGASKVLPALTQAGHLLGVLFGGGFAIAADRMTLRLAGESIERRTAQSNELHDVHRPVLIAIGVLLITGLAMATSDLETFLASPAFWIKISLVVLLGINGAWLTMTETKLRHDPLFTNVPLHPGTDARRWVLLRVSAIFSLMLWSATVIAGAALVNLA